MDTRALTRRLRLFDLAGQHSELLVRLLVIDVSRDRGRRRKYLWIGSEIGYKDFAAF